MSVPLIFTVIIALPGFILAWLALSEKYKKWRDKRNQKMLEQLAEALKKLEGRKPPDPGKDHNPN